GGTLSITARAYATDITTTTIQLHPLVLNHVRPIARWFSDLWFALSRTITVGTEQISRLRENVHATRVYRALAFMAMRFANASPRAPQNSSREKAHTRAPSNDFLVERSLLRRASA